jgi:hypothetical protein
MAQLPYIIYEQKPPMSSESFRELALSFLSKEDAAILSSIPHSIYYTDNDEELEKTGMNATGCAFVDKWREWERTLRLNMARERANKLKRPKASEEPPVVPADAAYTAIKAVVGDGSPLKKEISLDKDRWTAIEILAGNDYFHRNSVFAYYLKLMLLERRQLFNAETGFTEYKSIYAKIIENSQYSTEYAGVSK